MERNGSDHDDKLGGPGVDIARQVNDRLRSDSISQPELDSDDFDGTISVEEYNNRKAGMKARAPR